MKSDIYAHKCSDLIIPSEITSDVLTIIQNVTLPIKKNGASQIRMQIIDSLQKHGWSGKVRLDAASNISITAAKKKIGICVQLGNVSRIYADLIKLQTMFLRESIVAGIIILPSKYAAKEMGDNIISSNRLIKEIPIYGTVFTVPLLIIGFDK